MSETCTAARSAVSGRNEGGSGRNNSLAHRFSNDEGGNIAIIFGLMAFVVTGIIGGAVDIGRLYSARSQTQAAIDSALLAAGRTAQTTAGNGTLAVQAAQAYYNEMKSKIIVDDTIAFVSNGTGTTFSASGTAYVKMHFLPFACPAVIPGCYPNNPLAQMPVLTVGGSKQAEATIAQGGNSGSSIEVGLMLDTTGSMAGQKLVDLKAAATDLVDIVVWDDQSNYQSRIGIAPFSEAVNVGSYFQAVTGLSPLYSSHTEQVQTGSTPIYTYPASCKKADGSIKNSCKNQSQYITGYTPIYTTQTVVDSTAKATCVVERTGTYAATDTVAAVGSLIPSWNVVTGSSSTNCPEGSAIVPLTNNKTVLKSTITNLVATNSTAGAVGTAWAWYLISPNWSGIFTGTNAPESYSKLTQLNANNQPVLRKIAILMTDGAYNTYQGNSASVSTVNTKAVAICTGMKAKGIEVYTVGFDLGTDTTAKTMLQSCATDATHFYDATDGAALRAAFRDIALKLSALRLSH